MLNKGYKLDLLQQKQDVFWRLTYSRSETKYAWIISLEVMKFVYLHTTYVLSVLIIDLNIICIKFWVLWICPRPTSYLYPISNQNMNRAKWGNKSIAYERLGTLIRPVRHEENASPEKIRIWNAAAWASSHFRQQVQLGQVPTFVTRCIHICKAGRDPSVKDATICREGCPVIFHKCPLSHHLGNFLDLRTCIGSN